MLTEAELFFDDDCGPVGLKAYQDQIKLLHFAHAATMSAQIRAADFREQKKTPRNASFRGG